MKKYIVYGKSTCPYCIKVVNKLLRGGKTFYVEMYDEQPEKLEEIKKDTITYNTCCDYPRQQRNINWWL